MNLARGILDESQLSSFPLPIFYFQSSEDVAAEILVFDNIRKLLLDVGTINFYCLLFHFRRLERNLFQNFFKDRTQAARANVFSMFVYLCGVARDRGNRI